MTTQIPDNSKVPAPSDKNAKSDKIMGSRPVTISVTAAHDGRLPVTVTVVPVADLDAHGGVFVDFSVGKKESDQGPKAIMRVSPAPDAKVHTGTLAKGDDAVASLAKKEADADKQAAKTSPLASVIAKDATEVTKQLPAMEKKDMAKQGKPQADAHPPIISHQIAQGLKLSVGQAETFRADVAVPPASPAGSPLESWYVRGRFQTVDGRDLKSAWLRVQS